MKLLLIFLSIFLATMPMQRLQGMEGSEEMKPEIKTLFRAAFKTHQFNEILEYIKTLSPEKRVHFCNTHTFGPDKSYLVHAAAYHGESDALWMLWGFGANVKIVNGKNETPLHLAVLRNHVHTNALIQILMAVEPLNNANEASGQTPLHLAVRQKYLHTPQLIQALLAKYLVSAQDALGRTPLHLAAGNISNNQQEEATIQNILRMLLANGASIDVKDIMGSTPLGHVIATGNEQLIKRLINFYAHEAQVNKRNGNYKSSVTLYSELARQPWNRVTAQDAHEQLVLLYLSEERDFKRDLSKAQEHALILLKRDEVTEEKHATLRKGLRAVLRLSGYKGKIPGKNRGVYA